MKIVVKLFLGALICVICVSLIFQGYSLIMRKMYPMKYTEIVEKYSDKYELDKYFVYSVIKCESGFNKDAISSVGAKGLMQVTNDTFEWLQTKINVLDKMESEELYKPEIGVEYGCYFLSRLFSEFEHPEVVLAAYHAGANKVRSWLSDQAYSSNGKTLDHIPFEDTDTYVKRVMNAFDKYTSLYNK